ncbi:hypothetical protein CHS0354_007087 [Potamilus streckersoni]|uniref:Uncharacterized protein n=1 Tax=Potamilus streckersoni TaxID=2493646 RepID=A0AAE0SLE2_9BIVA|nr:hypothetical protein CHS0354_007087 [Potamilus streckersoni]
MPPISSTLILYNMTESAAKKLDLYHSFAKRQSLSFTKKSKLFISEERNEISELLEKLERSQSLQEQSTIDLLRLRKKLQERHGDSKIAEHKLAKLT